MSIVAHKISSLDAQAMQSMRAMFAGAPKLKFEPASRAAFDEIMARAPAPGTVRFEQEEVGDISTMPPVRIDVGSAEVLLDDSLRFAKKAERAGLSCEVHVWEGMIHVFPSNFAMLQAAAQAVEDIGSFLAGVLETTR